MTNTLKKSSTKTSDSLYDSSSSSSIKKRSSFRQLAKLRPLTNSFTSTSLSSAAASAVDDVHIPFSSSSNPLNSSLTLDRSSGKDHRSPNSSSHLFMALKFDDEFECSKFYDFYRVLFTDAHNDDLFNPHYKPSSSSSSKFGSNNNGSKSDRKNSSSNLIKVIYKKITKNSISSPVAFKVINSLSSVDEEAMTMATTNSYMTDIRPAPPRGLLSPITTSSSSSSSSSSVDSHNIIHPHQTADLPLADSSSSSSASSSSSSSSNMLTLKRNF